MPVTPEAPLLRLETLLRHLGGTKSSLLVLDFQRGPRRSGKAASLPHPAQVCDRTRVPCQRQRGQGEPGRQAAGWTSAPLWGRGHERPEAWKGAWGLRLPSKAEDESFSFSQQSAGTPVLGKLYLVPPRISPRHVCDCGPGFIRLEAAPAEVGGGGGISWLRFKDDLAQIPSGRQKEITTRWVNKTGTQMQ